MNFDRLAPHYDWMEAVLAGSCLQKARIAHLDALKGCQTLLSLGEGHGPFITACTRRFPHLKITCVEASAEMQERARRRLKRNHLPTHNIQWVQAELPQWTPSDQTFDAIATHFFLDCFPNQILNQVVEQIARAARPGTLWLYSDFNSPGRGWRGLRSRIILWLLYQFFGFTTGLKARTLAPAKTHIAAQGFVLRQEKLIDEALLRSELWQRMP